MGATPARLEAKRPFGSRMIQGSYSASRRAWQHGSGLKVPLSTRREVADRIPRDSCLSAPVRAFGSDPGRPAPCVLFQQPTGDRSGPLLSAEAGCNRKELGLLRGSGTAMGQMSLGAEAASGVEEIYTARSYRILGGGWGRLRCRYPTRGLRLRIASMRRASSRSRTASQSLPSGTVVCQWSDLYP